MSSPIHSLFDYQSLENKDTKDCHLSIQIGLHGLSYCIKHQNTTLAIESYHHPLSQLESTIKNHRWLSKEYASTNIGLITKKSTLIPVSTYDATLKDAYLSFNHIRTEKLEAVEDKLENIDSINLYGISIAERNVIDAFFPKATIKHYGTALLKTWIYQNKNASESKLLVSIQEFHMEIALIDSKGLQFFNIFQHSNAQDVAYNILFTLEQLNLNPESILLDFYGEVKKDSDIYKIMYTYIRNIQFGKRNEKLSPVITDIPEHFYFNLIHQQTCE